MAYGPTPEQSAICQATGRVVKANAFAGTGKSSTFMFLAKERPKERMLYVAFNKAIQLEAESKFPANVRARTGHSLAYAAKGRIYGSIHQKLQGGMRPFHIAGRMLTAGLSRAIPESVQNLFAGRVIETVNAFLVSADKEMHLGHVSIGGGANERNHFDGNLVLKASRQVWDWMQDPADPVPMLHDGYLKQYQLSEPVLPYDRILFDEAQDTNPVMQAIVGRQTCRLAYVGDRHQAIYRFRGAANAMESIQADEQFGLTGSFRFGPGVAEVANRLLRLKREPLTIKGLGSETVVEEFNHRRTSHALISRGNVALFHEAVRSLAIDRPFSFVGNIRDYRFDQITEAYHLMVGHRVRDPFISSFASFDELAEYGESMDDREIKGRVRVVTQYQDEIPHLVEQIHAKALPFVKDDEHSAARNTIVLMTAHKSKGLEFDNVVLADGYQSLFDDEGGVFDLGDASPDDIEELNLLYVAATRAKKRLQPSKELEEFLDWSRRMDAQPRARVNTPA